MKIKASLAACVLLTACGAGGVSIPDDFSTTGELLDLVELCGNPNLLGNELGAVEGSGACGISDAVAVRYVSGVRLSTPARLNCETANTLADWVRQDAQPAVKKLRSRITEMRVMASYACRSRNSQRGARLSEHAQGNAIDIGSFTLANGNVLSVEDDWNNGRKGAALDRLHSAACGPFGTVLGPDSDRFHYNHFHFDTAGYRSGAYCR